MNLEITGKITKFLEIQSGKSEKTGNEWKKQQFVVDTGEEYNNIYCFEVFGVDKVDNLEKFNKVGDNVKILFNVNTNEYKGKYYTSLSPWRIEKVETENETVTQSEQQSTTQSTAQDNNDLPF